MAEFYRANQSGMVPLLILPLKVSLHPRQSSTQFVVLVDGPVITQSGRGGRRRNKMIDGYFIVQEVLELVFRARLRTPLHEISDGAGRKALRQFIRSAIGQQPIAGDKMKSPTFYRRENADKRERASQSKCHRSQVFRVARRYPLLQNASWTKALPDDGIEIS